MGFNATLRCDADHFPRRVDAHLNTKRVCKTAGADPNFEPAAICRIDDLSQAIPLQRKNPGPTLGIKPLVVFGGMSFKGGWAGSSSRQSIHFPAVISPEADWQSLSS